MESMYGCMYECDDETMGKRLFPASLIEGIRCIRVSRLSSAKILWAGPSLGLTNFGKAGLLYDSLLELGEARKTDSWI